MEEVQRREINEEGDADQDKYMQVLDDASSRLSLGY